ncbi:hypothetical protein BU24DRAFT_491524 [Aaosphaeria arxii CBS 175.79]|uniref:Peptidase S33 tripeptidyl aminopeptidase-like C-terminal domain-containing protein n=1 Tax=Aaosphaeria arxii CBS 175.79 TaxID=1450172 RepID=A0A6A5XQN8_9PLEO|nr:uncharacterized protein BU24DRAFT_491524 [Aaosphaeria arxii CBS 175.79]KAF2015253.1 hypothetical protein BU24DRAFT_491524 [Aaosphaeria arxii CBS 175.79]
MANINLLTFTGLLISTATAAPWGRRFDHNETNTNGTSGMVYDYADITPSAQLEWVPCYDSYKCALLEVPLDYANPEAGTTTIPWIRQDVVNGTGQDIIMNPGGPSVSGVGFVVNGGGDDMIEYLGGKYNLVSFDPRGVNNSGISVTCYPGGPEARDNHRKPGSTTPLTEQWQGAVATGQFCTSANEDTEAKYVGTYAVVEDMMHFTELQAGLNGQNPEEALIWYYGISYGTVIGQTLATLYPERLGRVLLDGNVYGVQHYEGIVPTAPEDADNGMAWFFQLCFEAGPSKCEFAGNSSSPSGIEHRFRSIIEKIEVEPLIIPGEPEGFPSIVTKPDVTGMIYNALYSPMTGFQTIATVANAIEQGNTTLLAQIAAGAAGSNADYDNSASQEALTIITNVDSAGRYPLKNASDFINAIEDLRRESYYGADAIGLSNFLINAGMNIQPPESQYFKGFEHTQTSVPLLFVGTTGDPVTPLSSAFKMSAYFEGSVVLTQDTPGHSYSTIPSQCTNGHVQAYLEDGTLPGAGTVCKGDKKPLVDRETLPVGKRSYRFK